MEPLKIGIVGAGAIAQRNARESMIAGLTEIVGVFDVNHKVARDMASSLKTNFYSNYDELLNLDKLEAVLISTPHYLHKDQAIQAANKKKHVLIEKPLANNLEEAQDIIKCCKENKVKLTVNYSFRYLPKIQKAKELIEKGVLGEIKGIQIIAHQYKDPGYWTGARSNSPDTWRASKAKSGGGLLIMTTCHAIDYIYYITGLKATRIYCEYDTLNSSAEVEDILSLTCRFDNGSIGVISASSIMRGMEQVEERIWGNKGSMVLDAQGILFYSTRRIDGFKPGKLHKIKKFRDISWTREWVKEFVFSVRNGKTPLISSVEGWENLAFINAAYESLNISSPVTISKFEERWGGN